MSGFEDLIRPKNKDVAKRLAGELERFSFGVAVSSFAEVDPLAGPDKFVKTIVSLGGVCIDHAQHPQTGQQNITLSGENVPEGVAGVHYVFDASALILMPGFGPPAHDEVVTEVADTVQLLNDNFDAEVA